MFYYDVQNNDFNVMNISLTPPKIILATLLVVTVIITR